MRLIDADALSEKLCETTIFIKDGEVFQRMINDAPSADAVEVVRCKDCKYGEYRQDFDDYECGVDGCGLVYDADFYCSDGERREP